MHSYVKSLYLLIILIATSKGVAGQCLGGGIWDGGTPAAGTTNATGKVQGTVSVRAFTAATLAGGRPIYNSPSNTYGGFNYKALTVIRGAGFGSGYTYFKLATALGPTMIHLRVSDIRGDGFNTESQRVEGFNNGVPVAATFTDPVNGATVTSGNVITGPGSTNATTQASMRVFFASDVDSIKVTRTGFSDYVVIDLFSRCDILLPFTLVSFNSRIKESKVYLDWTVEEASGFFFYNIERSADGLDWKTIGFRDINDNNSAADKYQFIDEFPGSGRNYYRLKTVDIDGVISYSAVTMINNSANGSFKIKTGPNPFTSALQIESTSKSPLHVVIFSADGRKMVDYARLDNNRIINTSSWQKGFYFLQMTDQTGSKQTFKLVKQ